MTEVLSVSVQVSNQIGPGRLILVVGPSGAGKDTLLNLAKASCADDPGIVFTPARGDARSLEFRE